MTIEDRLSRAAEQVQRTYSSVEIPAEPSGTVLCLVDDQEPAITTRRLRLIPAVAFAILITAAIGLFAVMAPFSEDAPVVDKSVPSTIEQPNVTTVDTQASESTETTSPSATVAEVGPTIAWSRMELPATYDVAALDTIAVTEHGLLAGGFDGPDAAIWKSPDGATWERATIAPAGSETDGMFAEVVGFASLGARAVAVGFEGSGEPGEMYFGGLDRWKTSAWSDAGPVAAVWISDNGEEWTRVPHDESLFGGDDVVRMWALAASEDRLVAVGDAVWRSADGQIWERSPSPGGALFSVIFDGTQFVAAGLDLSGLPGMYRSADGIEWVAMPVEQGDGWWRPAPLLDVAKAGFAYAAVGQMGVFRAVDVSVEAEKIYQIDTNIGSYLSGIAVDGDRVVAVGEKYQGVVCTSTDAGQTWTKEKNDDIFGMRYLEKESGAIRDVALVNGQIVAVGRLGFGRPTVWIGDWSEQ